MAALDTVYRMHEGVRVNVRGYWERREDGSEASGTAGGLIAVRGSGVHSAFAPHDIGGLYPGRIYPSEYLLVGQNWTWQRTELPPPDAGNRDRRSLYDDWIAGTPVTQTLQIAGYFFRSLRPELID